VLKAFIGYEQTLVQVEANKRPRQLRKGAIGDLVAATKDEGGKRLRQEPKT